MKIDGDPEKKDGDCDGHYCAFGRPVGEDT